MRPLLHTCTVLCALAAAAPGVLAASPAELLATYAAEAGRPGAPAAGQVLFTTRQGRDWSCASCHGAVPTQAGRHAGTGKAIEALAPAADNTRFRDLVKSEKWFRRNCNDVLGRACTAGEKADVLAWLTSLKP